MIRSAVFLIFLISYLKVDVKGEGMTEVFGWKQMEYENHMNQADFVFPTDDEIPSFASLSRPRPRPTIAPVSTQSSSYIPYNNVPMGVNHYKEKLFITMPRRRLGIPSTLNYIDLKTVGLNRSPKLRAYPDQETNTLSPGWIPDPNRIISVYRTRVDACNRLWFIDTGIMELPNNHTQIQRPSIWIIDLETGRQLHRFEIPESIVLIGRGLASITVDVEENACDQAFAYIPDLSHNALYVYSLGQRRIWSFNHNFFHFDPTQGELNVGGQTFAWNDGIFSITLGKRQPDGYRTAFFHPMASTSEFTVSTKVLQNENNALRSYHGQDFKLLGSRGPMTQSTMHEFDPKSGIIFFAEILKNGVGCWNTKMPFSPKTHGQITADANRMIYPSDLTVDKEDNIWVMTNSMPIFIYSQLDPNVINFRVWKQSVREAVENTICEF